MTQTPLQPNASDPNQTGGTSNPIPCEKQLNYSPAELQYHFDVLRLVRNARAERERPRAAFNDMGFTAQDEYNVKLDLAYVPQAKDRYDIRIVSGLTREKTNTAVNTALGYDFETEFIAFDKNDTIIRELGDTASDLVEKSNQLEKWRQNRATVYRGQVARGTYFTMEVQEFPTKNYKSRVPLNKLGKMDVEWDDKPRKGKVKFHTQEIDPRLVILGDLKAMTLEEQPFIAVGQIISEAKARSMFGAWDRWNYVPLRRGQVGIHGDKDFFTYYADNFAVSDSLSEGEVELVFFMRSLPFGNELCIYLNGVAMTPIKVRGYDEKQERYKISAFPLTAISASGEYPIVDWHFERIPGFFYSKGQPAKTKFDQDVLDFWFKFMLKKAVRSINPTLGNKSGQILSNEELQPGNIISNIRKDDLFSILPAELIQGVTSGEVSVMEMLKKEIDEKTMSREFSGDAVNQYQTASAFMENKKAQLLKLGSLVDGIIRGEMRRADLRLRNSIIPYWMTKNEKKARKMNIGEVVLDIYDTFTVDKEGRDGRYDSSINVATIPKDADLEELSFEVLGQQEREKKMTGKAKKYTYLDPDQIDFVRTLFYIHVKPRERDNTALQRMLFDQDVATAKNLFGPEATNDESLKVKFAQIRGHDYDTWFKEQDMPEMDAMLEQAMRGAGGESGGQPQQGNVTTRGGLNAANAASPAQMTLQ